METKYLSKAQKYLSQGNTLDSIQLLKENVKDSNLRHQILQLEIRVTTLQRKINSGIIDNKDAQLEENRINNALLLIISNLTHSEKGLPAPLTPEIKTSYLRWGILGFLSIFLMAFGIYWQNQSTIAKTPVIQTDGIPTEIEDKDANQPITDKDSSSMESNQNPNPPKPTKGRGPDRVVTKKDSTISPKPIPSNLKTVTLKDGRTWIAANLDSNLNGSYCLDDNSDNCKKYGRLYTWEAAKIACPDGWHLPSLKEWETLRATYKIQKQKEAFADLVSPGGFNVIMAGNRSPTGNYDLQERYAFFWTSTELNKDSAMLITFNSLKKVMAEPQGNNKANAFSCRCIKNTK